MQHQGLLGSSAAVKALLANVSSGKLFMSSHILPPSWEFVRIQSVPNKGDHS